MLKRPDSIHFPVIRDTYNFKCTMCGNCCTGDQNVFLDLFDLYKMARFLNFDNTAILFNENYVEVKQNENGFFQPIIKFKTKPYKFCPFLVSEFIKKNVFKSFCKLHSGHKPLVCSMSPIGRIIDITSGKNDFVYAEPAIDCPGVEKKTENKLSDLKNKFKKELDFQKRFYALLASSCFKNMTGEQIIITLYSFQTDILFEKTISNLEKIVSMK